MNRHPLPAWSFLLITAALGCGGTSKSTGTHGAGATGGAGAGLGGTGGNGGNGGSSTSESGGNQASGGSSTGGTATGGSGVGDAGENGSGGSAGRGALGGTGGDASSGAGGTPGAGAPGAAGQGVAGAPQVPTIGGTWRMFWFEDPVTVSIGQDGSALSGTGCCTGLDLMSLNCCGPLTGTCENGRASFAFTITNFDVVYGTNVYVSEDRNRMGGTFTVDGTGDLAVAWVRIPNGGNNLGTARPPLSDVVRTRAGRWDLRLLSAFAGRFAPLETYTLTLGDLGYLSSDFGPFYWGDMTWHAESSTLAVGPVPATDPSFATTLALRFEGNELREVAASYPGDPPYVFEVAPAP